MLFYDERYSMKMLKTNTKLAENVYYKARMKAAQYNEKLKSRDGAAEELHYSTRAKLNEWELGTRIPAPQDVLLMADLYNAPELITYYCKYQCPLGCDRAEVAEGDSESLDRITLKALSIMDKANEVQRKLLEITSDGKISDEEKPEMKKILAMMTEMQGVTDDLRAWLKKNREL